MHFTKNKQIKLLLCYNNIDKPFEMLQNMAFAKPTSFLV